MHTLILSEANKAQFVYLFFYRRGNDIENKKIIIYRWTVMLTGGRKCISRVILSYNLYFYHICNVMSYFDYTFKLLL